MKRRFTRLMTLEIILIVFVLASEVFAMATKPQLILPTGKFTANQITYLFSGKSVATEVEGVPQDVFYYFDQSGELLQLNDGQQAFGKWSVLNKGRLCIEMEGEKRDCRMIVKEDNQYNQYTVKTDNNHIYELTYVDFQDGNQLQARLEGPLLPVGTLNRDEVIQLFSGKTVESVTASQGRVSHTYYAPDGKIEQLREGSKRFGTWRVTDGSRPM